MYMSDLKNIALKLATDFITIPPENLDDHINKGLSMTGTSLHMDRAYIFEYDYTTRTMCNTYEWCAPGIQSYINILQDIPMDEFPEWVARHEKGKVIAIDSKAALPLGNLRTPLEKQDIKSILILPLTDQDRCLGFVGFDAVNREINRDEDRVALVRMIGEIYCNVLKRKKMNQQLVRNQKQYRQLVEKLPIGLYRRKPTPGGEFLMANTAMARIFGFERPEELVGRKIASFCVDLDRMKQCGLEMARTGMIREKEVRFRRRNGEIFWVSLSAREHRDERENILWVEGLVQDIDDKKRQEEEKERLRNSLQHAQRVEATGRLAGGIAHDINNLLVPILGYSDLLLTMQDQSICTYVKPIKEAGERIRDIVRQLLAFGRKQHLEKVTVELNTVVHRFIRFLTHALHDNVEIVLKTQDDVPVVEVDVRQLEQVILNLAINAQEAMPDGGKIIIHTSRIELSEDEALKKGVSKGTYAAITFTDTGMGMDKETMEQIFEPFFTTKSKEHGTGLGLATAYGIIKQHAGNIEVESVQGRETTFHILIPATGSDICRAETYGPEPCLRECQCAGTILLVEDDEFVNEFVTNHVLKKRGYNVISARNFDHLTEILSQFQGIPDLLITDMVMPGLNGKEIYAELKKVYPDMQVIYMSGNTPETLYMDPGSKFLQKPFSVSKLMSLLSDTFQSRG